jgi:hypothetical protein
MSWTPTRTSSGFSGELLDLPAVLVCTDEFGDRLGIEALLARSCLRPVVLCPCPRRASTAQTVDAGSGDRRRRPHEIGNTGGRQARPARTSQAVDQVFLLASVVVVRSRTDARQEFGT